MDLEGVRKEIEHMRVQSGRQRSRYTDRLR